MSPMWAAARVPLSNPPRPRDFLVFGGPEVLVPFAPADRRRAGRSGSVSGSGGLAAVSAARAALGAALNPYRKFSQMPVLKWFKRFVPYRLTCDIRARIACR